MHKDSHSSQPDRRALLKASIGTLEHGLVERRQHTPVRRDGTRRGGTSPTHALAGAFAASQATQPSSVDSFR